MPKVVDHVARRTALAEAVWRVITRDGLAAASVRAVAAEAGLSAGSLRHFFPAQSDLLVYAMNLVVERIESRVASIAAAAPALDRAHVEERLYQLLPLDDERRVEGEVWLAFTGHALVRGELRQLWTDVHRELRNACSFAVESLGVDDVDDEARRLQAIIDGLAVHAALSPEDADPQRLTAVLTHHLDELETAAGPRAPAS
jgi:AcrR family transcriptional regulator